MKPLLDHKIAIHFIHEDESYKDLDIVCPISREVMCDPVIAADGQSYEKKELEKWFATQRRNHRSLTSPCTNEVLANDNMMPNIALKKAISGILANIVRKHYELVDAQALYVRNPNVRELHHRWTYLMTNTRMDAELKSRRKGEVVDDLLKIHIEQAEEERKRATQAGDTDSDLDT